MSGARDVMAALLTIVPLTLNSNFASAHDVIPDPEKVSPVDRIINEFATARANADMQGLSAVVAAADSVAAAALLWNTGLGVARITACFWNGDTATQKAVIQSDKVWEGFAAITVSYFDASGNIRLCKSPADADVWISLDGSDKRLDYQAGRESSVNWSDVGRSSTFSKPGSGFGSRYLVTVNLPGAAAAAKMGDKFTFDNLVGHELGHVRALLHDHQREICKGWFNTKAIAESQHWPIEKAESAVEAFSQQPQLMIAWRPTAYGPYDKQSIMQYNFAANWYLTKPGQENPCLRDKPVSVPSPGDIATLITMYGPLGQPGSAYISADSGAPVSASLDQSATVSKPAIDISSGPERRLEAAETQFHIELLKRRAADASLRLDAGQLASGQIIFSETGTLIARSTDAEKFIKPLSVIDQKRSDALTKLEAATRKLIEITK